MVNMVYALLIDMPDGMVSRSEVKSAIDKLLATPLGRDPDAPDRETWGTSAEAQANQERLMALAGGPATRPPDEGEQP